MERSWTKREEANALTCCAFRNGYIEELPAGKHSELLEKPELSRITDAPAASARQGTDLTLLTDRELEVFRLIGRGLKTGDIARELHRSVNTIEAHRAAIKRKFAVTTGAELARLAYQAFEGDA